MEIDTHIEIPDLARLLNRNEFRRFSDSGNTKMEDMQIAFQGLALPRLSYRMKKIEAIEKKTIRLSGGVTFNSPKLAKVMKYSDDITCFVATIGNVLDHEVAWLNNANRLTEAYILDSLGSMVIEHTVNEFHKEMGQRYGKQGKGVTLRFSPGYCDWPVTDQKKLFLVLDAEQIGVTLNESCLMHPRKSISGVFGICPVNNDNPIPPYNPCSECKKKDCVARRN
ncbi:MAG: vitamin B12 dependent-methionine synthase activation domain-containing protein [Thermodesulfobacteriota bacterium]|nr:vitamin B12 dependent-methionine synthase activation domain-containing protein [Thermodesulfobacteriota bacterium]